MQRWKIGAVLTSIIGLTALTPVIASAAMVTVAPGQSLWSIANDNHVSLSDLEASNPTLDPWNLAVGAQVKLPQTQIQYTVQPGDTLYLVARKFGISMYALEAANPTASVNNLLIGTHLTVPGVWPAPKYAAPAHTTPTLHGTVKASASRTATPVATHASHTHATSSYHAGSSSSSVSSTDLYWMSRLISAEAQGLSMSAQIAVGDVVMNRVHSPDYPNTVQGVIFGIAGGHYQFTPVLNGTIYNAPTASAVQAARDVLQNHTNLVPSAYVFYSPSKTPAGSWVWSQPTVAQYGDMVFAQ